MKERWFGFAFAILGLGFLVYRDSSATGAVISTTQTADIAFVLSTLLMIIGGFLIVRSFRKK